MTSPAKPTEAPAALAAPVKSDTIRSANPTQTGDWTSFLSQPKAGMPPRFTIKAPDPMSDAALGKPLHCRARSGALNHCQAIKGARLADHATFRLVPPPAASGA